ncbi:MAG: hypothetical protein HRU15_01025, partial [Planctomycetes bacterium]|nr:hypothetical protein [Planctomycetota bacterium]
YDAYAQLSIGGMLTIVGLYLIWKNRGLLIGQAIAKDMVQDIQMFIADIDGVDQVIDVKTRQLSAHTFRVKAEIVFSGGELAQPLIGEYRERVKASLEDAQAAELLGRFAHDLMRNQALFIDDIESKLRQRFPQAVHIDLEPHHPDGI